MASKRFGLFHQSKASQRPAHVGKAAAFNTVKLSLNHHWLKQGTDSSTCSRTVRNGRSVRRPRRCPACPHRAPPGGDSDGSFDRNVALTWRAARGSGPGGQRVPRAAWGGGRLLDSPLGISSVSDIRLHDALPPNGRPRPPRSPAGLSSSGCPFPPTGLFPPALPCSTPPSFIYSFNPL